MTRRSGGLSIHQHHSTSHLTGGTVGTPPFSPAVVSFSAANGTNTNAVTITAPTSITSGNILLAFLYNGVASGTFTYSGPTGWSQLFIFNTQAQGGPMACWVKTATGSEPANYGFSCVASFICGAILNVSGSANTLDGTPGITSTNTPTTSASAPSVTPVLTNDIWVVAYGTTAGTTASTPTGFTLGPASASAGNESIAVFYKALTSNSATGTAPSTLGASSDYTAGSFLVK